MKRFLSSVFLSVFILMAADPGYCRSRRVEPSIPAVGQRIFLSEGARPPVLQGMRVYPDRPLYFDFILEQGEITPQNKDPLSPQGLSGRLRRESEKLLKYFLASLTIPQQDLWVNLSPQEKDRIIPPEFGKTLMGQELLAQDYLLKQLTASLTYPEYALGKQFWETVYARTASAYPQALMTKHKDLARALNVAKVWIVPDVAEVYVQDNQVFILQSRLKVMLQDGPAGYRSLDPLQEQSQPNQNIEEVIRDILLPALEKEVNEGAHFAPLRQIYHSMILATWFKKNLRESLLNRHYCDQKKTAGVQSPEMDGPARIYEQYIASFKEGVFDYIKEEYDETQREVVPRRYFAGGLGFTDFAMRVTDQSQALRQWKEAVADGSKVLFRVNGIYQEPRDFFQGDVKGKANAHASPIWALETLREMPPSQITGRVLSLTRVKSEGTWDFEIVEVLRVWLDGGELDDVLLKVKDASGKEYILKYDSQSLEPQRSTVLKGRFLVNYEAVEDADGRQIVIGDWVEAPAFWGGLPLDPTPESSLALKKFLPQVSAQPGYFTDWILLLHESIAAYEEVEAAGFYSADTLAQNYWVSGPKGALTLKLGDFGGMLLRDPGADARHWKPIREILSLFYEQAPTHPDDKQKASDWSTEISGLLDSRGLVGFARFKQRLQKVYEDLKASSAAEDTAMATLPDGLTEPEIEAIINLPDEVVFPEELRPLMQEYAEQEGGDFAGIHTVEGDSEEILAYLEGLIAEGQLKDKDVIALRFQVRVSGISTRAGIFADRVDRIGEVLSYHSIQEPKNIWKELAFFSGNYLRYFNYLTMEYMHLAKDLNGLNLQGRGIGKKRLMRLQEALSKIIPGKKVVLNDVTSLVNASILEKYLGAVFHVNQHDLDKGIRREISPLRQFINETNAQARRNIRYAKIRAYVAQDPNEDVITDTVQTLLNFDFSKRANPTEASLKKIIDIVSYLTDAARFFEAITLKEADAVKIAAQAQVLYMKAYMSQALRFTLFARIPGELTNPNQDSGISAKKGSLQIPLIPPGAYDVLDITEMRALVKTLQGMLHDPGHSLPASMLKALQGSEEELSLEEHAAMLQRLGRQAGLKGPSIYMPFGGMDVLTPFRLVPGAEDVVVVDKIPFGAAQDIIQYLVNLERLDELTGQFRTFDYEAHYLMSRIDLGSEGLGALAVFRIPALLKGEILSIHYFDLDSQGKVRFLDKQQVLSGENAPHAVISFYDPETKKEKRFWHLQQNFDYPSEEFEQFLRTLRFESLIIKAPLRKEWDEPMQALIFSPAKMNQARILHDEQDPQSAKPHAIWKEVHGPTALALNPRESFGYSQKSVYYGKAEDLKAQTIDKETVTVNVFHHKKRPDEETKGGIDLNADQLQLNERGDPFAFDLPPTTRETGMPLIQGLTPVIWNITPVRFLDQ